MHNDIQLFPDLYSWHIGYTGWKLWRVSQTSGYEYKFLGSAECSNWVAYCQIYTQGQPAYSRGITPLSKSWALFLALGSKSCTSKWSHPESSITILEAFQLQWMYDCGRPRYKRTELFSAEFTSTLKVMIISQEQRRWASPCLWRNWKCCTADRYSSNCCAGGRKSKMYPDGVKIDASEFPSTWFEGLKDEQVDRY